ncbi:MAG TPA: DNA-3-methyladenine glycosylase [Acidimicrobiales bacterium]|nr:DNA-3-methyladenine glycosylase [Acidimicrobiales bacterium]
MTDEVISREFFERPSVEVARDLVGCTLVVQNDQQRAHARLVETEAYGGLDDPASHSYRGPTPRSAIMFGPAGFLYVYFVYGMHWCANVVTGPEGVAGAVLLRAAQMSDGGELGSNGVLRGPGNLTRGLGIDGADNGSDCCAGDGARIYFVARAPRERDLRVSSSTRIGVTRATERPWRFFEAGHPAVSKRPTSASAPRKK